MFQSMTKKLIWNRNDYYWDIKDHGPDQNLNGPDNDRTFSFGNLGADKYIQGVTVDPITQTPKQCEAFSDWWTATKFTMKSAIDYYDGTKELYRLVSTKLNKLGHPNYLHAQSDGRVVLSPTNNKDDNVWRITQTTTGV